MIISAEFLAKEMNISKSTLMTWMSHFTLSKYIVRDYQPDSCRNKRAINYTRAFIKDFRAYCEKKLPQRAAASLPLDYYKKQFEKVIQKLKDEENANKI